jgi:hypothetical protein
MWYRLIEIADWFGDLTERYKLIKQFNRSAKLAFVEGIAPTLLEARITMGNGAYSHEFSKLLGSGFRIKALAGRPLEKSELIEIGRVVLDNKELVRKLVTLGWDTLEIHSNQGYNGAQWPLKEYAGLGGFLN